MAKKVKKRKYKHGELADIVASYLMTAGRMRIVCKEMYSKLKEVPDIYAIDRIGTYMIEVKVSHKDFWADAKKPFRQRPKEGLGRFRYYACPAGMIKQSELPPKWGLIYVHPEGEIEVVCGKRFDTRAFDSKYWFQPNYEREYWAMYALLRKAVSWGIGEDAVWKYNKDDFVDKDEYYGEDLEAAVCAMPTSYTEEEEDEEGERELIEEEDTFYMPGTGSDELLMNVGEEIE